MARGDSMKINGICQWGGIVAFLQDPSLVYIHVAS